MSLLEHIRTRFQELSIDCHVDGQSLIIDHEGNETSFSMEEGLEDAFRRYSSARSVAFDPDIFVLTLNHTVEMRLTSLGLYPGMSFTLRDSKKNTVVIDKVSTVFSLAHFDSVAYPDYFEKRIKRRLTGRKRRITDLFFRSYTATYTAKGRKIPEDIIEIATRRIKSCLFKLAVEQSDCYSIWKPTTPRIKYFHPEFTDDFTIPVPEYDENVVSYYMVAKSSQFASQSFLSFYHVLEYYFLRVSEDILHQHLKTLFNSVTFRTTPEGLDRVISLIRSKDLKNDETEMLRNVIERFVSESDLIEFVTTFESFYDDKIYTKKRHLFGEQFEIIPKEGHVISNTAKLLKHIRNAIVHSSDRYKREVCYIPLTGNEATIEEFIPLVRFLAEKVIYGTATCNEK